MNFEAPPDIDLEVHAVCRNRRPQEVRNAERIRNQQRVEEIRRAEFLHNEAIVQNRVENVLAQRRGNEQIEIQQNVDRWQSKERKMQLKFSGVQKNWPHSNVPMTRMRFNGTQIECSQSNENKMLSRFSAAWKNWPHSKVPLTETQVECLRSNEHKKLSKFNPAHMPQSRLKFTVPEKNFMPVVESNGP